MSLRRYISLFSGGFGLDLGMEAAGFEAAVCVEIASAMRETIRYNRPHMNVLEDGEHDCKGDLYELPTSNILQRAGLRQEEADLVVGGSPCQSFSILGKRQGFSDPQGGRMEGGEGVLSFETIYEHYYKPIYRYVLSLVEDSTQAEDLTQDVFLRVWRALPRMPSDLNVSPWLYRIAKNISIDVLRRRRLIAWSSLEADVIEKEGATSLDPQARYDGCSDEVQLALTRMPDETREMLLLYEVKGFSYEQIAQRAQSAPGGVKMALTRARKKFKQQYQEVKNEVLKSSTPSENAGACEPSNWLAENSQEQVRD